MSGVIHGTCEDCGDVEVRIDSAWLTLGLHPGEPSNVLEFPCPACARPQRMPAGERATRLLGRAGITIAAPSASSNQTAADGTPARDVS